MQMPFCAIMRSWTLLATGGGSYAPVCNHNWIVTTRIAKTCGVSVSEVAKIVQQAGVHILAMRKNVFY